MCTMLLQSETLPAEKRSRKDSQAEVDKLMEYDRKLSEPFTREELQKILAESVWGIPQYQNIVILLPLSVILIIRSLPMQKKSS